MRSVPARLAPSPGGLTWSARRFREDSQNFGEPEDTPLTHVEQLWGEVFPGRELHWRDWKPLIRNRSAGAEVEYSGTQMSDGEKAVLYLAGRVFSAEAGIVVVDEPETHLHSLLAVRLWNALEAARPDVRFVYVTHDLTFAMSRRDATYLLSGPLSGLRKLDLSSSLPTDVAEALLGSASLSFYASRVIFCEGEATSLDVALYSAWFNGADTVVRPVGSCQRVIRCVDAATTSGIAAALTAVGLVDSDYHPEAFGESLPAGVRMLATHEVESLMSLPAIVEAVCSHMGATYDPDAYSRELRATVSEVQERQVIVERWKQRLEPHLEGLVSGVSKRQASVTDLVAELPAIFDHTQWQFSPEAFLVEEQTRVQSAVATGSTDQLLRIMPGKQMLPIAARYCGLSVDAYINLVIGALSGDAHADTGLPGGLAAALAPHLPDRHVAVKGRTYRLRSRSDQTAGGHRPARGSSAARLVSQGFINDFKVPGCRIPLALPSNVKGFARLNDPFGSASSGLKPSEIKVQLLVRRLCPPNDFVHCAAKSCPDRIGRRRARLHLKHLLNSA